MEESKFSLDQNDIPTPNFDIDSENEISNRYQNYNYISPDELAQYLTDPTSHSYDLILILDARFYYEHKGGRIFGALNITSLSSMIKLFQKYMNDEENGKSICIVIHCEYSSIRGPKLYDLFREYDRNIHISEYPKLSFPNLFLLEGGYRKFYNLHPNLCKGNYVSMYDSVFVNNQEIKRCMKNYFYDYREKLGITKNNTDSMEKINTNNNITLNCSNKNLKLNFKFNSCIDSHSFKKEIHEEQIESQPKTLTFSYDGSSQVMQLF